MLLCLAGAGLFVFPMSSSFRFSTAFPLLAWIALAVGFQPWSHAQSTDGTLTGRALKNGLLALYELDYHLHAGLERPVSLEEWLDLSVADGRKAVVLLDHLELYRKLPEEYLRWKPHDQLPYKMGRAGHRQFFEQVDAMRERRKDLLIFKGWEISETELDTGLDLEAMRLVDVVGWHISPNNGRKAPDGRHLLRRARQVLEAQKQVPVPMILFHPFTMRVENIQRTALAHGRDLMSITVDEYRFFRGNEQKELADLLRGTSVYIEISRESGDCKRDPVCWEALVADIRPLAEMGVQFTVSTDAHGVADLTRTFRPEEFCAELGCTPENTNTLLRELLAIRARQSLRQ